MQTFLLMLLAALVACVIPFQAIVNGRLGVVLNNPLLAALVSFTGGAITLFLLLLITTPGLPQLPKNISVPWYLLTGGLFGVLFVTSVLMLVPRIGVANVVAATIVGQLIMAILMDHFAILGVPQFSISVSRVLGCILLISGLLLIQMKS